MNSMNTNDVWDLEEIPNGAKIIGCKRVYSTKCDSKENVERYKVWLVAKGFTQREWIDYDESFLSSLMQELFWNHNGVRTIAKAYLEKILKK